MSDDGFPMSFPALDTLEYGGIEGDEGAVCGQFGCAPPRIFSTIPELIEDVRMGKPIILVDSHDRENEGDIVMPAQFADDRAVNFMARHARGLICLAITPDRAAALRLRPMVARNGSPHGTAFTVSIEAARGVTPMIAPARSPSRSIWQRGRPIWSRPATSSRSWRARKACSNGPAIPRRRSTSPGSPASSRPASSARS